VRARARVTRVTGVRYGGGGGRRRRRRRRTLACDDITQSRAVVNRRKYAFDVFKFSAAPYQNRLKKRNIFFCFDIKEEKTRLYGISKKKIISLVLRTSILISVRATSVRSETICLVRIRMKRNNYIERFH